MAKPDSRFLAARGRAYLAHGAYKLALRDFEEALKHNLASGEGYAGRGFARVKLGEWRKGVADARKAVQCKPATPYVHYAAACTLAQAAATASGMGVQERVGCLKEGVERLQRALEEMPVERRGRFWREKVEREGELRPLHASPLFARLAARFGGRK